MEVVQKCTTCTTQKHVLPVLPKIICLFSMFSPAFFMFPLLFVVFYSVKDVVICYPVNDAYTHHVFTILNFNTSLGDSNKKSG